MSGEDERRRLLKIRKRITQRRPKFTQFESWRLDRVKDHWRKPKGIDNKMRQNRKGWPRSVNVGWMSPKAVRGLHPSGMEEVAIYNVGDLTIIDPETQVARIGGSVGAKKRNNILEEADRRGIRVLNPGKAQPPLEIEEEEIEEVGEKDDELEDDEEISKEAEVEPGEPEKEEER